MKTEYDFIKKPVLNEKANILMGENNQYTFVVAMNANKIQIKKSIEAMFNVVVKDVKTLIMKGKKRRVRIQQGKRPNWKKAIVTLKEGDVIELFEGV